MEDIKKIQEFFSKPVKENSRRSPDFILIEPAEIKYTESFGSGIKAPGVLHHANEGVFLGAEGAYIIVLPGGTFYVDEDKEEAIRIYPLKDQSRELQLALDYTPFSPKYETWKSWVKKPKTLEGAYSGFRRGEPEDPDSVPFNPTGAVAEFKEDLRALFGKFKGDLKNPEFIKGVAQVMISWKSLLRSQLDGVDEATKEEETEFHKKLDTLVHDTFGKRKGEMEEYNTGIYYKDEKTQDKTKEASKSALEKVKDMIQKVLKEEEGYSQFLKTDDNPEGKTKGLDTATMNKILMNVIKDLDELKQLGEGVIEEELCAKGKAYIKKRQAAGEKSSAYLSGRAVKVCKGQMKG